MNFLTTGETAKKLEKWADQLKNWADNLSYNLPSATKIELTPSWRYKKVILLLLMKTNVGAKVKRDFDALDKLHAEYESWRGKAITEDNEDEFRILVDSLKGTLYDLADTLQQIADSAREELSSEQPAETERNAIPAKIFNIGSFKGVLGDIQAENVQTGDYSSIHKQPITAERKRGIIKKILKIVGAIVVAVIAAIVVDIFADFGWLQSIKEFIYNLWRK